MKISKFKNENFRDIFHFFQTSIQNGNSFFFSFFSISYGHFFFKILKKSIQISKMFFSKILISNFPYDINEFFS
jgi:hypothetical protein